MFFPALSTFAAASHFRKTNVFKNCPIRKPRVIGDSDSAPKKQSFNNSPAFHWQFPLLLGACDIEQQTILQNGSGMKTFTGDCLCYQTAYAEKKVP
jgi:hypothetical protein